MWEFLFQLQVHKYPVLAMGWNVFLALVPCLVAYFMIHAKKVSLFHPAFIILFIFWLLMLPNAPYLFFMTRHIVGYCAEIGAHRVCEGGSWIPLFFFAYALVGVPTFYYALHIMTRLIVGVTWQKNEVIFPLLVIPVVSIGLMLGLYERFNSWNILNMPGDILQAVHRYFTDMTLLRDFLVFTAILYGIYFTTDYLLNRD
jgi:uncharacterized membrane protein